MREVIERLEALLAEVGETTEGSSLERMVNGQRITFACADFIREEGPALLRLARAVEDAPEVTLSRADVGAWNLPDSASGQRVRLLPWGGVEG